MPKDLGFYMVPILVAIVKGEVIVVVVISEGMSCGL